MTMTNDILSPKVVAIAAMDEGRVIGKDNKLPWKIPEDMQHFAKLTTGHTVVMGRKTYVSIPKKFRPLPNRKNIVVTRTPERLTGEVGIETCTDLVKLISDVKRGVVTIQGETLWIIGGSEIYTQSQPYWDGVELTLVSGHHDGDAFFPKFEVGFYESARSNGQGYSFISYIKV